MNAPKQSTPTQRASAKVEQKSAKPDVGHIPGTAGATAIGNAARSASTAFELFFFWNVIAKFIYHPTTLMLSGAVFGSVPGRYVATSADKVVEQIPGVFTNAIGLQLSLALGYMAHLSDDPMRHFAINLLGLTFFYVAVLTIQSNMHRGIARHMEGDVSFANGIPRTVR